MTVCLVGFLLRSDDCQLQPAVGKLTQQLPSLELGRQQLELEREREQLQQVLERLPLVQQQVERLQEQQLRELEQGLELPLQCKLV